MGQCANAGNSQAGMNSAVTTSTGGGAATKDESKEPLVLNYRSTLNKGSQLKTAHLLSSEPTLPPGLGTIVNLLVQGSSGASWVGSGTDPNNQARFTRNYQTSSINRIPLVNPVYTDPYGSGTSYNNQYLIVVGVSYQSIGSVANNSCVIDDAKGFFLFDYTNANGQDSGVTVNYLLSNVHGVTILWTGNGITNPSTGVYTVSLSAAATSGMATATGAAKYSGLGIVQVPSLTKKNLTYGNNNPWKLDITFDITNKRFTFVRSNVPHPATIQFSLGSSVTPPAYTPSYPNVSVPAVVNSVIGLLCGGTTPGSSSRSWNGTGLDTSTNPDTKFSRSMLVEYGYRTIYKNPTYDNIPDQYITACSVSYTSTLTSSGEFVDQAVGYWIFDFSDYLTSASPVTSDIKLYYQLANVHGVNILYSGVLEDVVENGNVVANKYQAALSASVPSGLIQTAHLQAKNNVTDLENPPPDGASGPWTLTVTFDIAGTTFTYIRANNPHPASIHFS